MSSCVYCQKDLEERGPLVHVSAATRREEVRVKVHLVCWLDRITRFMRSLKG